MKKILSLLVCLSIMLSCVVTGIGATTAYAAEYEPSPEGDFIAFDGAIEEYIGPGGDIVIPTEIDGVRITEIYAEAFQLNNDITSVVIPEGIEKIGHKAFNECKNLVKVELPYSLYELGAEVFRSTGLTEIVIPGGLEKIPYGTFCDARGLTDIKISNGVKEIHTGAFGLTSPKRVIFPESLDFIAAGAFDFTFSMSSIEFVFCNDKVDMGRKVQQGLWEDMMKGNWSDEIDHIWCSSPTDIVLKAIVPEGSEVGEKLKNAKNNGLLHPDKECCNKSDYRVVEEDEDYFKDIEKEIEEWSIEETREELKYGASGSTSGGEENEGSTSDGEENEGDEQEDGSESNKKNPSSNKNNKNDKNNTTTTLIEEGDNSTMWIILGVVGGVMLLLIIGVVVFAVIFLKKPAKKQEKKEETLEELEARLAAMKEAPAEETPTEDAE